MIANHRPSVQGGASKVQETILAMPFVRGHLKEVKAVLGLDDKLQPELIDNLVLRFAAQVWDLPASESDHHSGPWGLLYHSLEVANLAAHRFKAPGTSGGINDHLWRYAAYLSGLGHDIGKVMDVEVTAAYGNKWNPFVEPLADYGAWNLGDVRVRHRVGRTSQDHVALWPYFFSTLLTPAVARFLQPILLELLLNESPNARAVWSAVRRADLSSARGLSRSPP